MMLASAGLQIAGTVMQAKQAGDQMSAQRSQLQEQEMASRASLQASTDNRQRQLKRSLASLRASYGAAGVSPNEGSAAAVQAGMAQDAAFEGAVDVDSYERQAAARRNQQRALQYQQGLLPLSAGVGAASIVAGTLLQQSRLGSRSPAGFGSYETSRSSDFLNY